MAETALHRMLTQALLRRMARAGVHVTHAVGVDRLPNPYAVGRHEPDAIGWQAGARVVGEAKRGPELFDSHTLEQLRDFTVRRTARGARSHLVLCVPAAYRDDAYAAVRAAGGDSSTVSVVSPRRARARAVGPQAAEMPLQRGRVAPPAPPGAPLQRGRVAPVAPVGVPLQRGRERPVDPAVLAAAQAAARRHCAAASPADSTWAGAGERHAHVAGSFRDCVRSSAAA